MKMVIICKVEGCNQPKRRWGYCEMHSSRFKRGGTTDLPVLDALKKARNDAHPDKGGTPQAFIAANDKYQRRLSLSTKQKGR